MDPIKLVLGALTVLAGIIGVAGLVITLTASLAFTGAPTLTWLSSGNGIGTTLLDSDGTTPVPPEPFSIVATP